MAGLSGVINRLKVETIPGYRRSSRTSAPSAEAEARLKSRQKYRNAKYAYKKHGDSLLGMLIGIRDPDAMNESIRRDRSSRQNNSSSASGQGEDINMPSLEQGKPGRVVAKPTVAAIVRQLSAIATVASQITSALQAHQAALETRASASREAAKENALEHRQDAVMENNVDSNNTSLTPIGTAIDKLNKAITSFVKILKKKEEEQNSDNLADDIIDAAGRRGRRRFRFGRGARGGFARFGLGLAGAGLTAATLSSMVPTPNLTNTGATTSRNNTLTPRSVDLNNLTPAPAPDKSTATADISNAITPSVRSAGNLVEEQNSITQNDIAKMAGPLIATPFNKDNIKNIPISEASGSVDDALRKIIAGAPGKAGVDPSSGLIAPLSGIPALATSITGDIYRKLYNMNPDNDPLAAQRLAEIRKGVDSAFTDTLRPFINFSPQANANSNVPTPDATNVTTPSPATPDAAANNDGTASSPSVGTGATVSTQPTPPRQQPAPDAQQVRAPGVTADAATDTSTQTASDAQRVQATNDTSADTAAAATSNQGDGSVVQASITTGGNLSAVNDSAGGDGGNVSTAAPMPETKPTATSPMYASTGNILHDLFAWDKPYQTKAEKREQREAARLSALSNERERQARFGRAGILQSGISTTHVPNSVPSVKPVVPNGLVTSGVGDVPSPDFPFYEKYHTHLHFEGAMG